MLSTDCPIKYLPFKIDVSELVTAIDATPSMWNRHTVRTSQYVHSKIDDSWIRYNAWKNFKGDLAEFNKEHESVWYPIADEIPVKPVVMELFHWMDASRLGGVLITKIPPHGKVLPHRDGGWHAEYYEKFAIQLKGNDKQAFCFENDSLSALPGEVYTFDNSQTHWVNNDSDEDRMTLIICIRRI